ncbi:type VI secretion system membrane subunit TssM [Aquabacterium humicola]|uniref:type VI secretion system membrane subunit TssM n=1 Tax=Aquabacterium humicola TaxID=3237377 RepID=UPI002542C2D3|nr:type VI secretion system membrane subunit TssM [Rubrivivax pictus]
MSPLLPRVQIVANIAGAALLVWLAAPLLAIGGRHPFDGRAERVVLLLAIAATAGLALLLRRWRRKRLNDRLFAQLQASDDASEALSQRFAQAMQLLRTGLGAGSATAPAHWWQRRRQVYQLPWYLFIGAPGAGKTTALLNAGLRFPLAERLGVAPVAGVGGTRQCDWWFTDQAVFIDTAGRYTTQDSRSDQDASEWRLFLQLLRRYRAEQPINGVIVTVSAPDLLQGGAELAHQAAAVDRRLQELRTQLGLSFPVYLLVTKADLLAGFIECFGDFDPTQREQPWGVTVELETPAAGVPDTLAARLAELPARIAASVPQRLQAEPLPERRSAIHHFPAQIELLLPALDAFLQRAFRHAADAPVQQLRGVHFSSGTQEGNPIDRVIGELGRSFGFAIKPTEPAPGRGKAFFLAGWLKRLVIAEAPLAGLSLARRRRRRRTEALAGSVAALVMLGACAGWVHSYRNNRDYVAAVRERVQRVTQETGPARDGRIDRLLPLYALLQQLAASGAIDPDSPDGVPWSHGLGLFQGPRLARSAEATYHRVLDRTFAPLVVERLTQAVRQERDPATRYEALRVALMLVTPGRLQRGEVQRWAAIAYAAPGGAGASVSGSAGTASGSAAVAPGAGEQEEWLRHFDALLERNAVLEAMRLDEATLQAARSALAAVPLEQRVHDRLLRRARERLGNPQSLAELASPAAVLAFAPADAASALPAIPVAFTREAWRTLIEPTIEPTIAELADEAEWVLGERSPALRQLAADRAARAPIARAVGQRHAQATIAAWDRLLGTLALQAPADADALARFATELAAAESPLQQLLRRITTEFAPAPAATTASPAAQALDAALAAHFANLREYAARSSAAIDRLLVPLPVALKTPAGPRAAELLSDLRSEGAAAPPPLREVWTGLAEALAGAQKQALERQLGGSLAELAQTCRRLTSERFPFAPNATRDLPYADFARLFGPKGLFDNVFRHQLAQRVNSQQRPWTLIDEAGAPPQAQAALRAFETAEDIRRLFFPTGRSLPQLQLQLTPRAMDGELLLFSLDVDGQLLRYENGPRRPKALLWPGPAATQKVVLRILPAGPSGVGAEVHEGPWALLRVLQRHGLARGDAARSALARVEVDGRALQLDVQAEGAANIALLGELSRFRCPEPW